MGELCRLGVSAEEDSLDNQHEHHGLVISVLQVRLSHDDCMKAG